MKIYQTFEAKDGKVFHTYDEAYEYVQNNIHKIKRQILDTKQVSDSSWFMLRLNSLEDWYREFWDLTSKCEKEQN